MTLGVTSNITFRLVSAIGKLGVITGLLVVPPLIGAYLVDKSLGPYLEFPPTTTYVQQPGFYWPVFVALLLVIIVTVTPFLVRIIRVKAVDSGERLPGKPLPSWGWLGCSLIDLGWVVAWSRYPPLETWQSYAFFSLWLGFILLRWRSKFGWSRWITK